MQTLSENETKSALTCLAIFDYLGVVQKFRGKLSCHSLLLSGSSIAWSVMKNTQSKYLLTNSNIKSNTLQNELKSLLENLSMESNSLYEESTTHSMVDKCLPGDLDFFIMSESPDEARKILVNEILPLIRHKWKDMNGYCSEANYFSRGRTTRFSCEDASYTIQFIHCPSSKGIRFVEDFDLSHVQWVFDGQTIWGTPAAFETRETGIVQAFRPILCESRWIRALDFGFRFETDYKPFLFGLKPSEIYEPDHQLVAWKEAYEDKEDYPYDGHDQFSLPIITLQQFQESFDENKLDTILKSWKYLDIHIPPVQLHPSQVAIYNDESVIAYFSRHQLLPKFLLEKRALFFKLSASNWIWNYQRQLPDFVSFQIRIYKNNNIEVIQVKFYKSSQKKLPKTTNL